MNSLCYFKVSLKKSFRNTFKYTKAFNHKSTECTYFTKHSLARWIITSHDYQASISGWECHNCVACESERHSAWWKHYALIDYSFNRFCKALTEHTSKSVMMREFVHNCHSDFQLWDREPKNCYSHGTHKMWDLHVRVSLASYDPDVPVRMVDHSHGVFGP